MKMQGVTIDHRISAVGAGILGFGLGALLAAWVGAAGWAIAAVGLVLHSWGMYRVQRADQAEGAKRSWLWNGVYWACWASLAAILVWVVWRAVA